MLNTLSNEEMIQRARLREHSNAQVAEAQAHYADCIDEVKTLNFVGAILATDRGTVRRNLETAKAEHSNAHAAITSGMADPETLARLAPALADVVRLDAELLKIENELAEVQAKGEAARLDMQHAGREVDRVQDEVYLAICLNAIRSMLSMLPEGYYLPIVAQELECPLERLIEIRDNASEAERLARQEQQAAAVLEAELSVLPAFLRGGVQ